MTDTMQATAGNEIPLPYVFFPKSNRDQDLDVLSQPRRCGLAALACIDPPGAPTGRQGKGDAKVSQQSSAKSERPPIMTPDERAWNERLIRSFYTHRSVIDAIVLSPNGVIISTLGRKIEIKMKTIDPGFGLGFVFTVIMLLNLFLFIWLVGSGFVYIRIITPFEKAVLRDMSSHPATMLLDRINFTTTTTISMFVIKSHVTFYTHYKETDITSTLFLQSKKRKYWESLIEHAIFIMTELLTGNSVLTSSTQKGNLKKYEAVELELRKMKGADSTPVPHCYQDYNSLRDLWNSLFYQCWLYIVAMLLQLFLTIVKVLIKQPTHFADPRDRQLTPEQMRSRIDIGLEGVAALQKICFFTKLILVMQAILMVMFQRILLSIKHVEYNSRQMANRLQKAGLPRTDVGICSVVVYFAMTCGTLQCLGFFCFHSLTRFYATVAATKVPQVREVESQDESYASTVS